jgi:hypothetical protein
MLRYRRNKCKPVCYIITISVHTAAEVISMATELLVQVIDANIFTYMKHFYGFLKIFELNAARDA